ncbi:MAG: preprotein translocase subunit YajC [Clostridiales bacterium]|nr:preprotein translocase subunit YajC [Clostridiales bacterium]MCD8110149.1 preprotein translocase subunit YajC [Clostridiales bacterium]MCD8133716.1 preprotein translocase subunit YajC [Clostridiales bacterium]
MYVLTSSGSGYGIVIWVVILVVFMFFFMIRPNRKEQARKNDMLSNMAVGDTVCTTGGFYGTLIDIDEDVVIVEFGNNKNCRIPMQRAAIAQVEKSEEAIEG